jgi:hypothetical protein
VSKVVAFLRAGYPSAMPATGYVPLAALLRRRLCEDEITAITTELGMRRGCPIRNADVAVAITRIADEMPSLDDIERVQRRLQATAHEIR